MSSISQVAAQTALEGPQECIGEMLAAFKERHDYVVKRLNAMPGVKCQSTDGTFYCFPSVHGVLEKMKRIRNDVQLSEYLIERAGVALVPGTAFGLPGHVRLSIATGMDNLRNALDRLEAAFAGDK